MSAISASLEHRGAARDVPADHLDRQAGAEDDARRLRIDPDVVFGRRRDVAFAARRAAHDDAAADLLGEAGIARQRQRDIGQRSERHQRQARRGVGEAQDRVDRMLALGRAARRRIAAVAEPVAAVEPMRVVERAHQRRGRADEDGDVDAGDLGGQQRVAGRLFDADVAGDDGQPEHAHVGRGERHQDRDGVVGSGVGVDEEIAHGTDRSHARQDARLAAARRVPSTSDARVSSDPRRRPLGRRLALGELGRKPRS